jgi:predicted transcriptional regulator
MKIRYDPDQKGLETILGPLEVLILQVLWEEGANWPFATNRRIHREVCRRNHPISLSTLTTTTRRMVQKGWLKETEPHNIFCYEPVVTEDDLIQCVIERVIGSLIVTFPEQLETYLEGIVPTEALGDKAQGAFK